MTITVQSVTYTSADNTLADVTLALDGGAVVTVPDLNLTAMNLLYPQAVAAWIAAGGVPAAYVAPVPASITRRQFYQQMAGQGIIQNNDAIAVLSTGTMPPPLADVIAKLPTAEQFPAQMFLLGGDVFERSSQLVNDIGTAYGMTSAQIDAFFTAAALL